MMKAAVASPAHSATGFHTFFILAVSNCGYIIFNFLNLNSVWIHRIDSAHVPRPYRAPTLVLVTVHIARVGAPCSLTWLRKRGSQPSTEPW
jgi:hypothetical protein